MDPAAPWVDRCMMDHASQPETGPALSFAGGLVALRPSRGGAGGASREGGREGGGTLINAQHNNDHNHRSHPGADAGRGRRG